MRNATPPKGVTAPKALVPVSASIYKDPENNRIPASKNQQTNSAVDSRSLPMDATTNMPSAWTI